MPTEQSTREQLVELAAEVFAEEGYSAASVRDVAARTGFTSGAIYGNFGSKAGLLLAAIDAHIERQLVQEPPEGVSEIADVLADLFSRYPERSRLRALLVEGAVAGRSDAEVRDRLVREQTDNLEMWAEIYRTWQERHEIDPSLDIRAVVTMLWSMELGFGVLEAIGTPLPQPSEVGDAMRRLVRGLAEPRG
jgi:AcrR family transcriptional regulator